MLPAVPGPFRRFAILACVLFLAARALAQATVVASAPFAEVVHWAIADGGVPADAWPAIDEAFLRYRAAYERLAERDADPWADAEALERGELTLEGFLDGFNRRLERCLAEERGFTERMHAAMGDDEVARLMAQRWHLDRMCRLLEQVGEYRLLPTRRTMGLARGKELQPCVGSLLPQAIAAAERSLLANLPHRELQRQASVGFQPSTLERLGPTLLDLATATDKAHLAFLQSLRRLRECALESLAGEERAARLSRWWGPPKGSVTDELAMVALRHLRVPASVHAALDGAVEAHVAGWEEGIAAWTRALDRCIANGDLEAFRAAWKSPVIQRVAEERNAFLPRVSEILGPELVERWSRIAGRRADLTELQEAIDPAHLEAVVRCDRWYESHLLGWGRPPLDPSALILGAGPIQPMLEAELRTFGEGAQAEAIEMALSTHRAAWAETVEPAVAALQTQAPELAARSDSFGSLEQIPAKARAIRRVWTQVASVDDALFSAIAAATGAGDRSVEARREREIALALLRLRRTAALVSIRGAVIPDLIGTALAIPVDPGSALERVQSLGGLHDPSAARRILADTATLLVEAMRETAVRYDAMLAITRMGGFGPGPDATREERQEFAQRTMRSLTDLAATYDCSMAAVVAPWSAARTVLLTAWDGAVEPEAALALRGALIRAEHPRLAEPWMRVEEGIRELLEFAEAAADRAPADAPAEGPADSPTDGPTDGPTAGSGAAVGVATDDRSEALRRVRREHSKRVDARLRSITDRTSAWAVESPRSEDWTGFAPETWTTHAAELARFERHLSDDVAQAWRDIWLLVGEDDLRRTAAGRVWLGPG